MKKSTVFPLVVAVAGTGLAAACAPQPAPPAPPTGPALGCYTGTTGVALNVDANVVGAPGDVAGIVAFDPGSDCSTNVSIPAGTTLSYVAASDEAEALTACQAIDPANNKVADLADFVEPAPGLSGYFSCSAK